MVSLLTQISLSYAVLKVKELIDTGVVAYVIKFIAIILHVYYMMNGAVFNRVYYWNSAINTP